MGTEWTSQKEAKKSEKKKFTKSIRQYKILPVHIDGLAWSRVTSMPTRIQHAYVVNSSKKFKFFTFRL